MNDHEPPDPILHELAGLHPMAPSAALDRRVIARCHTLLARQRRPARMADLVMAAAIAMYGVIAAIESARLALVL